MRQKFRKILTVLLMAVTVMGLTACGSSSAGSTVSYDQSYLASVADFLIASWSSFSEEEIAYYATLDEEDAQEIVDYNSLPFTAESFVSAFSVYESNMDDLGDYVSTDSYEITEADEDGATLVTHMTFSEREADLTIEFTSKSVVDELALDPEYSLGEIFYKAGMNTILGMGVVFAVLIFISLVIYCFSFIPKIQAKFSRKKTAPAQAAPATAAPVSQPEAVAEEPAVDDGELVAAITAAICAYTGSSEDGFVVRSIRRADSARWKRS
ncbi:MAG: OadG family protein [Lachnospiraceae bacterium]|nr:OadG family protein [Lachnospiraceae bacterium]